MTREEIIALAKQHGASAYTNRHYQDETYMTFSPEKLESFFHAAQDLEREACAKVCADWIVDHAKHDNCTYESCDMVAVATDLMAEIKNQGKTKCDLAPGCPCFDKQGYQLCNCVGNTIRNRN